MAFVHNDLRRVLAYSSVGQIGIVAMGIGLADVYGLTGAILHLVSDALMKGALFVAAGIAVLRFGVNEVDDLQRLRGRAPWTSAAIAIAGLSLIGVPPLAGFYGKWYVLSAALMEGRWAFVGAIVLGSIASIGYVFRIIERLYFVPAPTEADDTREGSVPAVATAVAFALGTIVFGLFNAHIVATYVSPALPAAVLP
jgi:multicomponent Na+:H+ antiporter subunit D